MLAQAFTQGPNNLTPLGPDLYFAKLNARLAVAQAELYIFNVSSTFNITARYLTIRL